MKKSFLLTALSGMLLASTVSTSAASPDDDPMPVAYTVDAAHSKILFKVRHLGLSSVTGNFGEYSVDLVLDPADLTTLKTTTVVQIPSIDTGVERRDGHLRSADFFDAETYPEMRFVSREVRSIDGASFQLVGDLTIRDITKEVVLDGEMLGPVAGPMGKQRVGFNASTKISRAEYGLKWNQLTEVGGIMVGDEVTIILEIEAVAS